MNTYEKIVFTDLDGTLLCNEGKISEENCITLRKLGYKNICRVIATGRNLYSARKVLKASTPIDYLVFSNGAGILDWKNNDLIYSKSLDKDILLESVNTLLKSHVDFMVHKPIPENHYFFFHRQHHDNKDFERRIKIYEPFSSPLNLTELDLASQLLAVIPNDLKLFNTVKNKLQRVKVIRTTSPLNGKNIWIEIFPEEISKGSAAVFLCCYLKVSIDNTIGIGNDYNDIDLLRVTSHSYVVGNAPQELKNNFYNVDTNNNHGFRHAIEDALGSLA